MLLAMKLKAVLTAAALASPFAMTAVTPSDTLPSAQEFAALKAENFSYRVAGDFSRDGKPVAAPLRRIKLDSSLAIMTRQVTAAEYARCVDDGGCPRIPQASTKDNMPMVGVNWRDATAYARWMTRITGKLHRLPTDEEWVFAAAEKASDDALPVTEAVDPVRAWIARYEAETSRERPALLAPQPVGAFGRNERGLRDVAGNVWEWTDTCFLRHDIEPSGTTRVTNTNCGVRVVQGAHRAYMTDFIRDPRSGGCAAGVPPANLGFRLVIEQETWPGLRWIAERAAGKVFGHL
ncbi:MAG: SUMF1/EgtB/PvdO family nonheme iron enzyme [Rhizobiales bacterium]|nr:SUMF1/EgtB/PvdO family nonheme iron enzyme [Hyphomicrobiales bacterium]